MAELRVGVSGGGEQELGYSKTDLNLKGKENRIKKKKNWNKEGENENEREKTRIIKWEESQGGSNLW